MREAVDRTLARFGRLDGVIHAAGLPGSGLIQLKTASQAAKILAPKVAGTLVLDSVLRGIELDFLALFSSVTAVVGGGPGQVDYCAANAFLDAFAQRHASEGRVVVSINWGEWQWNSWESEMAGLSDRVRALLKENRERFGIPNQRLRGQGTGDCGRGLASRSLEQGPWRGASAGSRWTAGATAAAANRATARPATTRERRGSCWPWAGARWHWPVACESRRLDEMTLPGEFRIVVLSPPAMPNVAIR